MSDDFIYSDLPPEILDKIQGVIYGHARNDQKLIVFQRRKYGPYENDQNLILGFEGSNGRRRYLRISYYGDIEVLPGGNLE